MNKKSYIPEYKDAIKWKRPKAQKKVNLITSDITDEDIKNASLAELKDYLEILETQLQSLQSKKNSESNDEKFGGVSSQFGFRYHNEIQVCKRQIDIIKTKIKEFNNNKR